MALRDAVRCSQGRAGVHLVWQHHMDKVAMPAGWTHAVCNLSPNTKFAMDGAVADEFVAYVHVEGNRVVRHWLPASARGVWCGTGCRLQQTECGCGTGCRLQQTEDYGSAATRREGRG